MGSEAKDEITDSKIFRSIIYSVEQDKRLSSFISTLLDTLGGKSKIPVLILDNYEDRAFCITYIMNLGEVYSCKFSYYTILGKELMIVYDGSGGFIEENQDFSRLFLDRVKKRLNNDMLLKDIDSTGLVIDGKKYEGVSYSFANPTITYRSFKQCLVFSDSSQIVEKNDLILHNEFYCDNSRDISPWFDTTPASPN